MYCINYLCDTIRQSAAAASSPNVDLTYYNTVSGAKGGNRGGKKNKIQVSPLDSISTWQSL